MTIGGLVTLVAILIFAAHFFGWIFGRTKMPDALLLMLVGLILGPGLGWIKADYFGEAAELAVVLVLVIVLFEGGLDLRFQTLREAWRGTMGLATISFITTMVVVGGLLWGVFGMNGLLALTVGAIVGGTSSVVVIPLVERLKIGGEAKTMLTLESVFSDVLVIVITIALLEAWQAGHLVVSVILWEIIISFVGAMVLGILVAFVWARLLNTVRPMRNSVFTTPAAVLLLFGFVEQISLSGPIAALAFGVVMGNMGRFNNYLEKRHPFVRYALWSTALTDKERVFFSETVFLLQTFFFVFIGLSLQINNAGVASLGLALAILMFLIRPLIIRTVVKKNAHVSAGDAVVMSVMVPKGLAAAALATLPLQMGVAGGEFIQGLVYAIILFSVLLTSALVYAVHNTSLRDKYLSFFKEQVRVG